MTQMAHDVFVSYSSKDKPTADGVCALLESRAIRCWIAPRDVVPGKEWGASIIEALGGARVMVLIFSGHANKSPQIRLEVERAVNKGITIIPVRIENIVPTESLELFLSARHWLDAYTPPMDDHLNRLALVIQQILGVSAKGVFADAESGAARQERDATEKMTGQNVMQKKHDRRKRMHGKQAEPAMEVF